jgi:hypothetical protein
MEIIIQQLEDVLHLNNTTASNNTALGCAELSANTTGCQNVAVGSFALDANTLVVQYCIGSINLFQLIQLVFRTQQ